MKKYKLHKIAPVLSRISSANNAFKIPENYFETIEDLVVTKLKAEVLQSSKTDAVPNPYFETIEDVVLKKMKRKSRVISLKNRLSKYTAPIIIAASLLLFIILNNNNSSISFDSIVISDIENSIEEGLIEIDAEYVATIFSDIEITDNEFVSSLSDEAVLEYLIDEELDALLYEN